MSASVESVIAQAEAQEAKRAAEVYVKDGTSERVEAIRGKDGVGWPTLVRDTRGGYEMYGAKVKHEGVEKTYFMFLADVPKFFKAAERNDEATQVPAVIIKREGKINSYT